MTLASTADQSIASAKPRRGRQALRVSIGTILLLPAIGFLLIFLIVPSLSLLSASVLTQSSTGDIGLPVTLANYDRLLFSPAYQKVVLRTLSISIWTSVISIVLAYPLAMVTLTGGRRSAG